MEAARSDWPSGTSDGPSASIIYQQNQQNQQSRTTYRSRKKLRESCNNCALSKVKCSKEQPVCARCDEREMYCHYSPTRRIGKRRVWSHISAEEGSEVPLSLKDISPEEHGYFDYRGLVLNQDILSRDDLLETRNSDKSVSSQSFAGLMSPPLSLQIHTSKGLRDMQSQTHGTMFSKRQDTSMLGDSNSIGSALGYIMDHPSDLPMASGSYEEQESLLNLVNQDSSFNVFMPEPESGTKSERRLDQPQHCMNRALDSLQKLHTPQSNCSLVSGSKTNFITTPPTRSIDQVLSINKEILDVIHQILDCPCSLDIQFAFILTTITSKIISWYNTIAQNNEDQTPGSISYGMATSPTASPDISNLPVTVAKYQLDGESNGQMRAQLVLSELHLVLRLIDKLVARFKGLQFGEGKGSDSGVIDAQPISPPVFVELETFLRYRLRTLAKETTERLRAS